MKKHFRNKWKDNVFVYYTKHWYFGRLNFQKLICNVERERQVILPRFSRKIWPYEHVKVYKSTEIHSVISPSFGGNGPWDQLHDIFQPQLLGSYFQLMIPTTKLIKQWWNLPKLLGERGSQTPQKCLFENETKISAVFMVSKYAFYPFIHKSLIAKVWKFKILIPGGGNLIEQQSDNYIRCNKNYGVDIWDAKKQNETKQKNK